MKKILLYIYIILPILTYSQNAQEIIDGLKKDLQSNPDDKKRASIYSDLTWYYSNVSVDSALSYGKMAIVEAEKLKDSTLLAQVYSDLGAVHFRKSDFASSKKSYLTAYRIRAKRNDKVGMAKISANLANIYNKENQKELALKSYLESVDYFEKINNLEAAAITNSNISTLFNDLKNYKKALSYLNKAISYQEKNNQEDDLANSYLTMANINLRLKDTLNALKFYDKSIALSKKTSNNITLVAALNNLSKIKNDQNKPKEAEKLIKESGNILGKINKIKDDTSFSFNTVNNLIANKKFSDAKKMLLKLKSDYTNDEVYKNDLLETYQYLAITCGYLNQPDSVNYYSNASMRLQDVVIEETVGKQTNELETKYQTAKKEKQLLEKNIEVKKKNNLIYSLIAIALFASLLGYLFFRQQKLKNKQQEQEFQLKSAIAQIETQNKLQEQRLSISRDLHDNIGAQLTFIISSVDNLKFGNKSLDDKITNQLSKISNFTKATIVELRDTIWAMNSNEFSFEDLRSRIYNFIEKAQSAKEDVQFNFTIDTDLKDIKLSAISGINVYRTIQEAVNNSVKYANANEITIDVKNVNQKINVAIKDNGNGFDIDKAKLGNGLYNMKKRIEEIGGEFEINSLINKGTLVNFTINK
jgi:signal transduction histidine kinase